MQVHSAILLLGPTGSGKTPLGEALEARGLCGRRCFHFDFGAQLRRAAAHEAEPAGLTAADVAFIRDVLDSGALLEKETFHIAETILRAFVDARRVAPADLIVLNGLPRHVGQAADVARLVRVERVVRLACDAETVRARIRTNAGGDRTQRTDDDPGRVAAKLATYERRTIPLIEYYVGLGVPVDTISIGPTTTARDVVGVLEQALAAKG
ncbi:MAG: nucleoside monophosphate kinase [Kiritimatiellae bacterium]|nr:nucleoside monophosphate kinase [Kiritimatiellia bacterium]